MNAERIGRIETDDGTGACAPWVIVMSSPHDGPQGMGVVARAGDPGNAPGIEVVARRAEDARRRRLPCGHCGAPVGRDYIVRVVVDMDDQRLDAFEGWIIHPDCWDKVLPTIRNGGHPSGRSFHGAAQ